MQRCPRRMRLPQLRHPSGERRSRGAATSFAEKQVFRRVSCKLTARLASLLFAEAQDLAKVLWLRKCAQPSGRSHCLTRIPTISTAAPLPWRRYPAGILTTHPVLIRISRFSIFGSFSVANLRTSLVIVSNRIAGTRAFLL